MRRTPGLVVAFSAALAAATTLAPGATAAPAQVSGYVVVLEGGAGPPAAVAERLADRYGGEVGFVYSHALRGFSIRTTDRAAAALASNPKVAYVEADGVMSVAEQVVPTGVKRVNALINADIDGKDGIGERVDVDVAVIDTGIDLEHPDLDVAGQTNCTYESGGPIFSRTASCVDGEGDDDHYHGTHVAGTIAAIDNGEGVVGVAPGARLWAVKVLKSSGSGSNAMVIAGIDWVAERADTIEVANMSLGGGYAQAVNDAVAGAVVAGVSMVVAAGNSSADVENYSPASEPSAITVSALADFNGLAGGGGAPTCRADIDDTFADFSNYGADTTNDSVDDPAVDMIAPGVCILSTYPLEQGSYGTISGTSMASPHVAGAVAMLRSGDVEQQLAEDWLIAKGNYGWDNGDDGDSTKEPLLDVSDSIFAPTMVGDDGGTTPTNNPPAASFTYSCAGLECTFTDGSSDSDGSISSRSWNFGDDATSTATNPVHTYAAAGTYTVELTVTDNDGVTGTTSQPVTVTAPAGDNTTPTFTPSSSKNGRNAWKATISVSGAAPGTTVSGTWDDSGSTSSGGCTTSSTGTCNFSLTKISTTVSSVTWTHTVSGTVVPVPRP